MKFNLPLWAQANFDATNASDETGLTCEDESKTQQQFAEEVDINTIIRRFGLDGKLPENIRMPTSGDFTNIPTFQEAMNAIRAAQESFNAMPARVRARFHNDPAEFVDFCTNKDNLDEAKKLGLVPPDEKPLTTTPATGTIPPAPAPAVAPAKS